MTHRDLQMKGGVQLPMFAVESEPTTVADPAWPVEGDEEPELELLAGPQLPIGDHSDEPEVDR